MVQNDTKAKIPAGEILWEQIKTDFGAYIVTSNQNRDKYYLYSLQGNKLSKKIGTAANPVLLKQKHVNNSW